MVKSMIGPQPAMDIIAILKKLIPSPTSSYRLLSGGGSGFYSRWDFDRDGAECLYYLVGEDRKLKRIPTVEIVAALGHLNVTGSFARKTFEEYCPIANNAGSCGYAALVRAFEIAKLGKLSFERNAWVLIGRKS